MAQIIPIYSNSTRLMVINARHKDKSKRLNAHFVLTMSSSIRNWWQLLQPKES